MFGVIIGRPRQPGLTDPGSAVQLGAQLPPVQGVRQTRETGAIIVGSAEIRLQNSIDEVLHVRGHKNRWQTIQSCYG